MDHPTFLKRADTCLEAVADWAEDFDPDELDFSQSDGILTLEFADGTRFVLNRQSGNDQMWFAAGVRAWHYDWDDEAGHWRDAKDGHELYGRIAEVVSAKLGRACRFGG